MLESTFCFLPGIGETREQKFWSHGIHTWSQFLDISSAPGISTSRKQFLDVLLSKAQKKLVEQDASFFAYVIPRRHQWRCFEFFNETPIYLDIETSIRGYITMIGIYNGDQSIQLVRGKNLDRFHLAQALKGATSMLTFNGASFDLPHIEREFPKILPKIPHIDLMHAARQIGLKGGLKKIEPLCGIHRPDDLGCNDGYQALYLWEAWEQEKDEHALQSLLEYNEEDIVNLEPLAHKIISRLTQKAKDSMQMNLMTTRV